MEQEVQSNPISIKSPDTYQSLTQLMEYWLHKMQDNVQSASKLVEGGNNNAAIQNLKENKDIFKIYEALQDALLRIHYGHD